MISDPKDNSAAAALMRNIERIVVAEFHVDKGPSLLHQIPKEIPGLGNLTFLPEVMLPDQIHRRDEDYTLFFLYRNSTTGEFQYLYDSRSCESQPYFLYTIVNNYRDDTYRRGSSIKALGIITRLPYFKSFKPLLIICLDKFFKDNNQRGLEDLYAAVNAKNFSVGSAMSLVKRLLFTSILDLPINEKIYSDELFRAKLLEVDLFDNDELHLRKDLSFNSIVSCSGINIPIRVPMIELPDTIGDYLNPTDLNFKAHLIALLNAKLSENSPLSELAIYDLQTPAIILIINAILTGLRIMILSYENSAGHIIDTILVILKIVTGGGVLSGLLTNYNIFPILDVSKIDVLEECDSYLAGTINPFFKHHQNLWDVLYDLDSNEITISNQGDEELERRERRSIISEDAKFLSNLQLSIFNYNDDLSTLQLIFRRHINEIFRILLSLKNFDYSLMPGDDKFSLLLDGIGYHWPSASNKLIEVSCYQFIAKKFQKLLFNGKFKYSLMLPNLANEFNVMLDLQYHIQGLISRTNETEEEEVWIEILKYLVSDKSLEVFFLVTYLLPPSSSTSLQSSTVHDGNLTIFDKNKGVEFLFLNLFNKSDRIKSIIIMIMQELQENFVWGWCLEKYIDANIMYKTAFEDLVADQASLEVYT